MFSISNLATRQITENGRVRRVAFMDKVAATYFQNTDPRFWSFWSFWSFVRYAFRGEPHLKTSADLHNLYVRSLRRLETSPIPHHNTKAQALMSRHKVSFRTTMSNFFFAFLFFFDGVSWDLCAATR